MPIRLATPTDIPALFAVRTSVRENHLDLAGLAERGVTPASLAAALADPRQRTWVADDGGEVVAFAMADAHRGCVFALFVRPDAEGRGHGRALLAAAEGWLRAQGWDTLWLATGASAHLRAHRLYRAAGWTLTGPAEHGDVRYEKRPAT